MPLLGEGLPGGAQLLMSHEEIAVRELPWGRELRRPASSSSHPLHSKRWRLGDATPPPSLILSFLRPLPRGGLAICRRATSARSVVLGRGAVALAGRANARPTTFLEEVA